MLSEKVNQKNNRITMDEATQAECRTLIRLALEEDLGSSDLSQQRDCTTEALIPEGVPASAKFVSRQQGVVCGVEVCRLVLETMAQRDLKLSVTLEDGQLVEPGSVIAELQGNATDILIVERTCLNFLGRLSGISTLTRTFLEKTTGNDVQLLDTRKTTPGWRRLEKYAVHCGGGVNHRMGLYDAILIKDNHLAMLRSLRGQASIEEAVQKARAWIGDHASQLPQREKTILQIEVDRKEQLEAALPLNPDIVLLDNMTPAQLADCVQLRNQVAPNVLLEASGGINLETVADYARSGVERLSIGALTHSAVNFDIGLDWRIEAV